MRTSIQTIRNLIKNNQGSAALFVGLGIFALVGATGTAMDMSRLQTVRAKLSNALDAAGLAAGAKAHSASIQTTAQNYLDVNFPTGFMDASITNLVVTANADNTVIDLSATASVNMTFMKVFGVQTQQVTATSQITRENRGLELAMVLDVTGSMYGSKISDLRSAATDMVNILFGTKNTLENLWVGIVPYSTTVNVGNDHGEWLNIEDINTLYPANYPAMATKWKGCVEARSQYPTAFPNLDVSDTPPYQGALATATPAELATRFPPFFWTSNWDNEWINPSNGNVSLNENAGYSNTGASGPNIGCGNEITTMMSDRDALLDKVDQLTPWRRGGTMSSLGLSWGWRLISPDWRGFWAHSSNTLPLDYGTALMSKAIILMTDGVNQVYSPHGSPPLGSDYTGYRRIGEERLGAGVNTPNEGVTAINDRTTALCNAIKARGILIYTVTFQLGGGTANNNARTLFRNCASHPDYYFDSPDGAALKQAFRQIGDSLANLMISQ